MPGSGSQGSALIACASCSSYQAGRAFSGTTSPSRFLFNASSFLRSAGPRQLWQVGSQQLHSGETHESRAASARPRLARARSRGVMAFASSTPGQRLCAACRPGQHHSLLSPLAAPYGLQPGLDQPRRLSLDVDPVSVAIDLISANMRLRTALLSMCQ
jgi:hypothetical protein